MVKEKIREAILEAIREKAKEAFDKSQNVVPVKTGNLKRSGEYKEIDDGGQILYAVEYASVIERGTESSIEVVNGFYRRDGTYVKSHTKKVSAKQGRKYIENSLKDAFSNLNSSLEYSLKRRFKKVI